MAKVSAKRKNKSVTVADIPRVGPGTPCGDWFRRYWVVVGIARDLYDIPQAVKVFGEALVLFRDEFGKLGLLGLHCPHRGTSLEYADIECGGIRCPYHGWTYDLTGPSLWPSSTTPRALHCSSGESSTRVPDDWEAI